MRKFFICGISIVSTFAILGVRHEDTKSPLLAQNIEALTSSEHKFVVECIGNTGTCAKGYDENTGHDFVIHGKAKILK